MGALVHRAFENCHLDVQLQKQTTNTQLCSHLSKQLTFQIIITMFALFSITVILGGNIHLEKLALKLFKKNKSFNL